MDGRSNKHTWTLIHYTASDI